MAVDKIEGKSPLWWFWYWIRERHAIYVRRFEESWGPPPWTLDPILQTYAFCNVFRELDRVTIWIREHWREPYADHPNLWFAMAVARQINWPETLYEIGFPDRKTDAGVLAWMDRARKIMLNRQRLGRKVYTGAYMLRGDIQGGLKDKPTYTIEKVLKPVWAARADWENVERTTLESAWKWFTTFHGWGGFLAYEVVTDLRHTRYLCDAPDIYTWANAGPGAIRGLNRIHGRPLTQQIPQVVANREMQLLLDMAKQHQPDEFGAPLLPRLFPSLEMRDIEHSLCEFDKYLRVKLGEGRPRAKFHPSSNK